MGLIRASGLQQKNKSCMDSGTDNSVCYGQRAVLTAWCQATHPIVNLSNVYLSVTESVRIFDHHSGHRTTRAGSTWHRSWPAPTAGGSSVDT